MSHTKKDRSFSLEYFFSPPCRQHGIMVTIQRRWQPEMRCYSALVSSRNNCFLSGERCFHHWFCTLWIKDLRDQSVLNWIGEGSGAFGGMGGSEVFHCCLWPASQTNNVGPLLLPDEVLDLGILCMWKSAADLICPSQWSSLLVFLLRGNVELAFFDDLLICHFQ